MKSPTNWEFFKQDENKILWVHLYSNGEILEGSKNWLKWH